MDLWEEITFADHHLNCHRHQITEVDEKPIDQALWKYLPRKTYTTWPELSLSRSELLGFDSVCHQGFTLNRCFTFPLLRVACRGRIALAWIVPSSAIWPIGLQQDISHTFLSLLLQTTHVCNRELSCKRQTLNHEPAKSCNMVPSSVSLERLCDVAFSFSAVLYPALEFGARGVLYSPPTHLPPSSSIPH